MIRYIEEHPYLFSQILSLVLFLPVVTTTKKTAFRKSIVLGGLAGIPASFFSILHEGDYWKPVRLVDAPWGLEDVLFSFIAGALAWFLAAFPFQRKITFFHNPSTMFHRLQVIGLTILFFLVIFAVAQWNAIDSVLISCAMLSVILMFIRPGLWPLAFSGAVLFPVLYIGTAKLHFLIWPEYVRYWTTEHFWGNVMLAGVPLGEYAWAFAFGATWPLIIGYIFRVDLNRPGSGHNI